MAIQTPNWALKLDADDWKLIAWAVESLETEVSDSGDDIDWTDDAEHGRTVQRLAELVTGIHTDDFVRSNSNE